MNPIIRGLAGCWNFWEEHDMMQQHRSCFPHPSTWIQVESTEGLLIELNLFLNTSREGKNVSGMKGDRQETAVKLGMACCQCQLFFLIKASLIFYNSCGWADPESVSITALMKRTPCREAFRTHSTRGHCQTNCPSVEEVWMSSAWTLIKSLIWKEY